MSDGTPVMDEVTQRLCDDLNSSVSSFTAGAAFRALLDLCPLGMLVYREGTIVWANSAVHRMFDYGYTAGVGELKGKPITLLIDPSIHAKHAAFEARYLEDRTPRRMGVGLKIEGIGRKGDRVRVDIGLAPAILLDVPCIVVYVRQL